MLWKELLSWKDGDEAESIRECLGGIRRLIALIQTLRASVYRRKSGNVFQRKQTVD